MVPAYVLKIFASWYSICLSQMSPSQNNGLYTERVKKNHLFDDYGGYTPNGQVSLWINRSSGKISESNAPITQEEPLFEIYFDAFLGIVEAMSTRHLVVVTGSDVVADIELGSLSLNKSGSGKIMTIREVKFFPVDFYPDNSSGVPLKNSKGSYGSVESLNYGYSNNNMNGSKLIVNEQTLDEMYGILLNISKILSTGHYYSNDTDLTNTMQSLYLKGHVPLKDTLKGQRDQFVNVEKLNRNELLYQVANQEFNWCHMISQQIPDRWKTVLIQGYVGYGSDYLHGEKVETLVIGRRSIKRSGTRFTSRGIDVDGNVGNFVDSEVRLRLNSRDWYSYTQVRGSVPLFWEQPGTGKKVSFYNSLDNFKSFSKHVDRLNEYYEPCDHKLFVSLLDVKENERLLTEYFINVISEFNTDIDRRDTGQPKIMFVNYNYNLNAKWSTHEIVISFILESLMDNYNSIGYFDESEYLNALSDGRNAHEGPDANYLLNRGGLQRGIIRTNCLDCLDRANIFQWIGSWVAVNMILSKRSINTSDNSKNRLERLLSDINRSGDGAKFFTTFTNLWCDHGDYISIHHTGAPCTLSKRVKQPDTSLNSLWYYGKTIAKRHYHSRFKDNQRQEVLDILSQYCTHEIPSQRYQTDADLTVIDSKRRDYDPYMISRETESYPDVREFASYKYAQEPYKTPKEAHRLRPPIKNVIFLDVNRRDDTFGYDVLYQGNKVIFKAQKHFLFGVIKKGKRTVWAGKPGDYPDIVLIKPGPNGRHLIRVYFPKPDKDSQFIYHRETRPITVEDHRQAGYAEPEQPVLETEPEFKQPIFAAQTEPEQPILEEEMHAGVCPLSKPVEIPGLVEIKLITLEIKNTSSTNEIRYEYNPKNQSHTFTAKSGYLIDTIINGGLPLWKAEDYGYGYGVQVYVGKGETGKPVFRVFFPESIQKPRKLTRTPPKVQPEVIHKRPEPQPIPEVIHKRPEPQPIPEVIHKRPEPQPIPEVLREQPKSTTELESEFESKQSQIKLISIDIKDRFSTISVEYKYDPGTDIYTFKSIYPYLIETVSKDREVVWDCKDYNYEYGNLVVVYRQMNGRRKVRVYFANRNPEPQEYGCDTEESSLQEDSTCYYYGGQVQENYTPGIVVEDRSAQ